MTRLRNWLELLHRLQGQNKSRQEDGLGTKILMLQTFISQWDQGKERHLERIKFICEKRALWLIVRTLWKFDNEGRCIVKFYRVAGNVRHLILALSYLDYAAFWCLLFNPFWWIQIELGWTKIKMENRMEGNNWRYCTILHRGEYSHLVLTPSEASGDNI